MIDWDRFEFEEYEPDYENVSPEHNLLKHMRKTPVIESADGYEVLHVGEKFKKTMEDHGCELDENRRGPLPISCRDNDFHRLIGGWGIWDIDDYDPDMGMLYNKDNEWYGYMPWDNFVLACQFSDNENAMGQTNCSMRYLNLKDNSKSPGEHGRHYHDFPMTFNEFRMWRGKLGRNASQGAYVDYVGHDYIDDYPELLEE